VRQGCLLPPFFFLLAIDWVMRHPQLQTEWHNYSVHSGLRSMTWILQMT
jgi:hypothetical protein